jgi:hypothetical protein
MVVPETWYQSALQKVISAAQRETLELEQGKRDR